MELQEINALTLGHKSKPKGINRAHSFHPNFSGDPAVLRQHLLKNFEKAYRELTDQKMRCKHVRVFLRKKDFSRVAVDSQLAFASAERMLLLEEVKKLFSEVFQYGTIYRTTGVHF